MLGDGPVVVSLHPRDQPVGVEREHEPRSTSRPATSRARWRGRRAARASLSRGGAARRREHPAQRREPSSRDRQPFQRTPGLSTRSSGARSPLVSAARSTSSVAAFAAPASPVMRDSQPRSSGLRRAPIDCPTGPRNASPPLPHLARDARAHGAPRHPRDRVGGADPARADEAPLITIAPAECARMLADDGVGSCASTSRKAAAARPEAASSTPSGPAAPLTITARREGDTVASPAPRRASTLPATRTVRLRITAAGRRALAGRRKLTLRVRADGTPDACSSRRRDAVVRV